MFSPGKVNSVALSQSFVLVFPYYFGQDFQSCFDPASDKAFIIDSFAEKAQSCFEKRKKGLEVSPSPTLFFLFSSTAFIPICIADPQLASGGIAVSTLWCLFI